MTGGIPHLHSNHLIIDINCFSQEIYSYCCLYLKIYILCQYMGNVYSNVSLCKLSRNSENLFWKFWWIFYAYVTFWYVDLIYIDVKIFDHESKTNQNHEKRKKPSTNSKRKIGGNWLLRTFYFPSYVSYENLNIILVFPTD